MAADLPAVLADAPAVARAHVPGEGRARLETVFAMLFAAAAVLSVSFLAVATNL